MTEQDQIDQRLQDLETRIEDGQNEHHELTAVASVAARVLANLKRDLDECLEPEKALELRDEIFRQGIRAKAAQRAADVAATALAADRQSRETLLERREQLSFQWRRIKKNITENLKHKEEGARHALDRSLQAKKHLRLVPGSRVGPGPPKHSEEPSHRRRGAPAGGGAARSDRAAPVTRPPSLRALLAVRLEHSFRDIARRSYVSTAAGKTRPPAAPANRDKALSVACLRLLGDTRRDPQKAQRRDRRRSCSTRLLSTEEPYKTLHRGSTRYDRERAVNPAREN